LNPTCIITQISPLGQWNILEAHVGEEIGVAELIETVIKTKLSERFEGYSWDHTGDPAGKQREQSDSRLSAVKTLTDMLGGVWRDGPQPLEPRIECLRNVLRLQNRGVGIVQVDKIHAKAIWYALRGGWHRKINAGGVISGDPVKNIHSHPADALGYGAARFFPLRKVQKPKANIRPAQASYFNNPLRSLTEKHAFRPPPQHGEPMFKQKNGGHHG
jgi:hypothetical protein